MLFRSDGPDHFFRVDESGQFMEVKQGALEDTSAAAVRADQQANPRFHTDRLSLATALAQGRNWIAAAAEFRMLAIAYPESSGFAFDAATSYMQAGDTATALQWIREAARRPDAPAEVVEAAKRLEPTPAPGPPKKAKRRSRGSAGNPRDRFRAHEPTGPGR